MSRVVSSRRSEKSLSLEERSSRGRLFKLAAAVALVGALVYLPSLNNGFTN